MPVPYSHDLRVKVINFIEAGNSVQKAIHTFEISKSAIYKWKVLKETTGDVQVKSGNQLGRRRIIRDTEKFKEFIKENSDKSTAELARMWPQQVCAMSINRSLKRLGYTFKKKHFSIPKGTKN